MAASGSFDLPTSGGDDGLNTGALPLRQLATGMFVKISFMIYESKKPKVFSPFSFQKKEIKKIEKLSVFISII